MLNAHNNSVNWRGSTNYPNMEHITEYDGSGLELVHISDVLDYLGENYNIAMNSVQLGLISLYRFKFHCNYL